MSDLRSGCVGFASANAGLVPRRVRPRALKRTLQEAVCHIQGPALSLARKLADTLAGDGLPDLPETEHDKTHARHAHARIHCRDHRRDESIGLCVKTRFAL